MLVPGGQPFRSGSARLGRSQKDDLPMPPWGIRYAVQGHPRAQANPVDAVFRAKESGMTQRPVTWKFDCSLVSTAMPPRDDDDDDDDEDEDDEDQHDQPPVIREPEDDE